MKFKKWFKNRVIRINNLYARLKNDYDVERVHKYRINLRELYACSEVYAKEIDEGSSKKFSKLIKNILKPTADLRDLDLFINEIDNIECKQPTKKKLKAVFSSKREKAFKKYNNTLKSSNYKNRLKKLKVIAKKSDFFIYEIQNADNDKIIKDTEKSIYKKYNKIDADTSFKEFHKLRKEFKKLRYGLDIYEHCFKKDANKLSIDTSLKELQDAFGAIQDNYVRLKLIESEKDKFTKKQLAELENFFKLKLEESKQELLK
jgi:CHAD domain-containing protein